MKVLPEIVVLSERLHGKTEKKSKKTLVQTIKLRCIIAFHLVFYFLTDVCMYSRVYNMFFRFVNKTVFTNGRKQIFEFLTDILNSTPNSIITSHARR